MYVCWVYLCVVCVIYCVCWVCVFVCCVCYLLCVCCVYVCVVHMCVCVLCVCILIDMFFLQLKSVCSLAEEFKQQYDAEATAEDLLIKVQSQVVGMSTAGLASIKQMMRVCFFCVRTCFNTIIGWVYLFQGDNFVDVQFIATQQISLFFYHYQRCN